MKGVKMMAADYVGQRFNKITIKAVGSKYNRAICLCDCGVEFEDKISRINSNHRKTCGCAQEFHGSGSPGYPGHEEYAIYHKIKARCENPKTRSYHHYGGRGIAMHPCWRDSFSAFLKDMGPRPSPKHSVERIDNNKGYEPGNCKWATPLEQAQNKRTNVPVVLNGVKCSLMMACRELGINVWIAYKNVSRKGKSPQSIIDDHFANLGLDSSHTFAPELQGLASQSSLGAHQAPE